MASIRVANVCQCEKSHDRKLKINLTWFASSSLFLFCAELKIFYQLKPNGTTIQFLLTRFLCFLFHCLKPVDKIVAGLPTDHFMRCDFFNQVENVSVNKFQWFCDGNLAYSVRTHIFLLTSLLSLFIRQRRAACRKMAGSKPNSTFPHGREPIYSASYRPAGAILVDSSW